LIGTLVEKSSVPIERNKKLPRFVFERAARNRVERMRFNQRRVDRPTEDRSDAFYRARDRRFGETFGDHRFALLGGVDFRYDVGRVAFVEKFEKTLPDGEVISRRVVGEPSESLRIDEPFPNFAERQPLVLGEQAERDEFFAQSVVERFAPRFERLVGGAVRRGAIDQTLDLTLDEARLTLRIPRTENDRSTATVPVELNFEAFAAFFVCFFNKRRHIFYSFFVLATAKTLRFYYPRPRKIFKGDAERRGAGLLEKDAQEIKKRTSERSKALSLRDLGGGVTLRKNKREVFATS